MMMGTVDVGRGIYYYAVISNGAREGARYAIVHGSRSQSLDGSCASGPSASGNTKDRLGALVVLATGAPAPAWASVPAGCPSPATVPAVGLDAGRYLASVCWSGSNPNSPCTLPVDCASAGSNQGPENSIDVAVTVRTCYVFQPILTSLFPIGPMNLAAQTTLTVTH